MSINTNGASDEPLLAPERDHGDGGGENPTNGKGTPPPRSPSAIVAALAAVPAEFQRLMDGRDRDDLAQPAQDGGWGLVEILPHMRDWELIYRDRLTIVLSQDEANLEEYDDSLWAIEHAYSDQDPVATWTEYDGLRGDLVQRLEALTPQDWERVVILPKRGRVTLQWLLDNLSRHDAKHIVQARDVLA